MRKVIEKSSHRAFALAILYAFVAILIYFLSDFKNPVLFAPACGYAIKGLYRRYLEKKF